MHKNPHQNAGNGIKKTLFFKIFLGSMPPEPSRGSRASGKFVSVPPKFLSPYAYGSNYSVTLNYLPDDDEKDTTTTKKKR